MSESNAAKVQLYFGAIWLRYLANPLPITDASATDALEVWVKNMIQTALESATIQPPPEIAGFDGQMIRRHFARLTQRTRLRPGLSLTKKFRRFTEDGNECTRLPFAIHQRDLLELFDHQPPDEDRFLLVEAFYGVPSL